MCFPPETQADINIKTVMFGSVDKQVYYSGPVCTEMNLSDHILDIAHVYPALDLESRLGSLSVSLSLDGIGLSVVLTCNDIQ